MGLNIFNRNRITITQDQLKQLTDNVSAQNELYQALYDGLMKGSLLNKDSTLKAQIKSGYEGNADVYSITQKIGTMFSDVPINVVDQNDEIVETGELFDIVQQPNTYQIMKEFLMLWEIFLLNTGNAIVYSPTYSAGNDGGKLTSDGMFMIPTQNTDIHSQSWMNPIDYYTVDIDAQLRQIEAINVMHTRFPNLQYEKGANFIGMSPVRVASTIIEMENQGWNIVATTLQKGIPPGILTKVSESYDKDLEQQQQSGLERTWKEKYGNQKKSNAAGMPVLTLGDVRWQQMGFSNFRDLQILENSQQGLRVLCNVWGVPSILFNDTAGSTFNNQSEARKAIYTNRIMPDMTLFTSIFNSQIAPAYGQKIVADYSQIPELQEDKKQLSEWLSVGVANGSLTRNEFREKLGLERSDAPGMDDHLVGFNLVSIGELGTGTLTEEEAEKMLKDLDIDDYKLRKVE